MKKILTMMKQLFRVVRIEEMKEYSRFTANT